MMKKLLNFVRLPRALWAAGVLCAAMAATPAG